MNNINQFKFANFVNAICLLALLPSCFADGGNSLHDPNWPLTDFSKTNINFDEIMSGGPPKDGIPAIDNPGFIEFTAADKWLANREPVIALTINGQSRAYPLQILIYHEIVNDIINDTPVCITFCPLCNAAIVFDRRVNGKVLDFGTTGKLRKSDMVMYDRQTESWWQQFIGEGIVGHYTGTVLKQLHASIVSYGSFKQSFVHGKVLSRDTGFKRPYGNNPYRGYDDINSRPFLFFDPIDNRLPAMERVLAISVGEDSKLYPLSKIQKEKIVHDKLNNLDIVIFSNQGMVSALDETKIVASKNIPSSIGYLAEVKQKKLTFYGENGKIFDRETGSQWSLFGKAISGQLQGTNLKPIDSGVHFAFAWLAFRPDSTIY